MSQLGDAIRSGRVAKGMSQVELADKFGISKSAVNQWESGKNVPDHRKLAKLVELLGLDPSVAAGIVTTNYDQVVEAATAPPSVPITMVQATPGKADIPLWASAAAGDDGAIVLVPDPIDYLRRSERMLNVRHPFAFNVLGASMSPAIEHGDQVVINPSITARPGMDCVFINEGAEGMLALVKRLLRPAPEQWHVRQFNEPRDFTISRKKWSRVHPIAEIRKAGVG